METFSVFLLLSARSLVISCTLSHLKSFSVGDSSCSEWYFDIRQKVRDPAWVDVTFYNSVWRIYGWGNPRRERKGLYFKRDGFDRKSNRACNEWWWVGKVLLQGETWLRDGKYKLLSFEEGYILTHFTGWCSTFANDTWA